MEFERRKTRTVKVGDRFIGSGHPVTIQSMTNTDTENVDATVRQINQLYKAGCEIVRVAVPTEKAAEKISDIVSGSKIPVIADIHFDYRLALVSIKSGINGIRINPGNIGSDDKVKAVAEAAGDAGISIRIGANTGSLGSGYHPKKFCEGSLKSDVFSNALVNGALYQCELLEKYFFNDIKVSLKASDVITTVKAYRKFAELTDYPLHLGVTEAGTLYQSTIKSSIGIGSLLLEGIGDTVRVSVTGDPVDEIKVARQILENSGHREARPEIISCPTCGRTVVNLIKLAGEIEERIERLKQDGRIFKPCKIAIMGCAVNGPGEAKEADLGIAGAKDKYVIFKNGKQIGAYPEKAAINVFEKELEKLTIELEN